MHVCLFTVQLAVWLGRYLYRDDPVIGPDLSLQDECSSVAAGECRMTGFERIDFVFVTS